MPAHFQSIWHNRQSSSCICYILGRESTRQNKQYLRVPHGTVHDLQFLVALEWYQNCLPLIVSQTALVSYVGGSHIDQLTDIILYCNSFLPLILSLAALVICVDVDQLTDTVLYTNSFLLA